jgi:hypothetical protein
MWINWDSTLHFHPTTLEAATHGIPVPVYGLYGGPGNSGPGAPKDELDAAYQVHDEQSATADTVAEQSAADVQLINTIAQLDQQGALSDPEASLYAGFSTLAILGELAINDDLELLGGQNALAAVVGGAIANIQEGLAGAPSEGRSLHGAVHVFEAKFSDWFF